MIRAIRANRARGGRWVLVLVAVRVRVIRGPLGRVTGGERPSPLPLLVDVAAAGWGSGVGSVAATW
jgi:hypothetical protein